MNAAIAERIGCCHRNDRVRADARSRGPALVPTWQRRGNLPPTIGEWHKQAMWSICRHGLLAYGDPSSTKFSCVFTVNRRERAAFSRPSRCDRAGRQALGTQSDSRHAHHRNDRSARHRSPATSHSRHALAHTGRDPGLCAEHDRAARPPIRYVPRNNPRNWQPRPTQSRPRYPRSKRQHRASRHTVDRAAQDVDLKLPPSHPTKVEIDIEIVEISQIQVHDQKFDVEFNAYFVWKDPRLAFDAREEGVHEKDHSSRRVVDPRSAVGRRTGRRRRGGTTAHVQPDGTVYLEPLLSRLDHGQLRPARVPHGST